MNDQDIINATGSPPKRRILATLRVYLLVCVYVGAIAVLFLSDKDTVINNRLWALLMISLFGVFSDYLQSAISTWVAYSTSFPYRLLVVGLMLLFCAMMLILGGDITNRWWAIGVLVQFTLIVTYITEG